MLGEETKGASQAGGNQIRGVAEEYSCFLPCLWFAPCSLGAVSCGVGSLQFGGAWRGKWTGTRPQKTYHVVDDSDGVSNGAGLEAHITHGIDELVNGDGTACEFIKVELLDFLGAWGHFSLDEDGICDRGGKGFFLFDGSYPVGLCYWRRGNHLDCAGGSRYGVEGERNILKVEISWKFYPTPDILKVTSNSLESFHRRK